MTTMQIVIAAVTILILGDIAIVVYVFMKRGKRIADPATVALVRSTWPGLISRLERDPSGVVMDADKLLAHALQRLGFDGSMSDKLKRAEARFSDANAVWKAHKLRNRIAHEVDVVVTTDDARRALRSFERALRDYKLLVP